MPLLSPTPKAMSSHFLRPMHMTPEQSYITHIRGTWCIWHPISSSEEMSLTETRYSGFDRELLVVFLAISTLSNPGTC